MQGKIKALKRHYCSGVGKCYDTHSKPYDVDCVKGLKFKKPEIIAAYINHLYIIDR